MGRPNRLTQSLLTAIEQQFPSEAASDDFRSEFLLSSEEELKQRRAELKNGLTDLQRLFLFGKLRGLNDKDAANCGWLFLERGREH